MARPARRTPIAVLAAATGRRDSASDDDEDDEVGYASSSDSEVAAVDAHAEGMKQPQEETYDPAYFDSDDEDMGDDASARRRKPTDDELLFDPAADDRDEAWMTKRQHALTVAAAAGDDGMDADAPPPPRARESDAILSCPGCFTVLCRDSQRHALYPTQFRAMFTEHCRIIQDQVLHYRAQAPAAAEPTRKQRRRRRKSGAAVDSDEPMGDMAYHPVQCEVCNTEVAVIDTDEVVHFFHVLAI